MPDTEGIPVAPTVSPDPGELRISALRSILAALLAAGALAALLALLSPLEGMYVATVMALVAGGSLVLWVLLPAHHPFTRLGPANQVTLARAVLVALLAGLIADPAGPSHAPLAVVAASLAAALDGLDGPLARHTRMCSPFGCRFDTETDALLILVLSVLAWQFGKAGPWVLAAGAMRYAFAAAGWRLPVLRRPLPPSRRRKVIAVVQTIALIVILAPFVRPPLSEAIALLALLALAGSFARDILLLARGAAAALATSGR